MHVYVLEFSPPMEGFDGRFNTVRVGKSWASRIFSGDTVYLLDKKVSAIFGKAQVQAVVVGKLCDLADDHAKHNHNQKANLDVEGAPARLRTNLLKRYGPQIINDNKIITVIYLKRIDDG